MVVTMTADQEIINKFHSRQCKMLQEHGNIKLPELAEKVIADSNYMIIDDSDNNWDVKKKSKLIESFIINFPVPPIIVSETAYCNKYKVIDGKQRVKTIVDFYHNKFPLTGLEVATKLNGCTYDNLPVNIRETLNRYPLKFINILFFNDTSPEEVAKLLDIIAERYK
jgi:hypothetical protein